MQFYNSLNFTSQRRLQGLKVYVLGSSFLALQVLQVLAECRLQLLSYHHPRPRDEVELLSQQKLNFYLRLEQLKGQLRGRLQLESEYSPETVVKHDVLVICDFYSANFICYEKVRRNSNVAIVFGTTVGLAAAVLSDFPHHKVFSDGALGEAFPIQDISTANPGVVKTSAHRLRTGDFVRIEGVQGMTQVNGSDCRPVKVLTPQTFQIQNTLGFGPYAGGGVARRVWVPLHYDSQPILDQLQDFADCTLESATFKCFLLALTKFHQQHDRLPAPYDPEDLDSLVQLLRRSIPSQEIDQSLFKLLAFTAGFTFQPLVRLVAGAVAFEAVKKIGRYRPLQQMLTLNYLGCVHVAQTPREFKQQKSVLRAQTVQRLSQLKLAVSTFGPAQLQFVGLLVESGIGSRGHLLLMGQQYSQSESGLTLARLRSSLSESESRKVQYLSCDLDQTSFALAQLALEQCDFMFQFRGADLPFLTDLRTCLASSPRYLRVDCLDHRAALTVCKDITQPAVLTQPLALQQGLSAVLESVMQPLWHLSKGFNLDSAVVFPAKSTLQLIEKCNMALKENQPLTVQFISGVMAKRLGQKVLPQIEAAVARITLCPRMQLTQRQFQLIAKPPEEGKPMCPPAITLTGSFKSLMLEPICIRLALAIAAVLLNSQELQMTEQQAAKKIAVWTVAFPFLAKASAGLGAMALLELAQSNSFSEQSLHLLDQTFTRSSEQTGYRSKARTEAELRAALERQGKSVAEVRRLGPRHLQAVVEEGGRRLGLPGTRTQT